jgi:hypothetical protein
MKVSTEKAELFTRSVYVLHSFMIKENKNEVFLQEEATEFKVAMRPITCDFDAMQQFIHNLTSPVRIIQLQNYYVQ